MNIFKLSTIAFSFICALAQAQPLRTFTEADYDNYSADGAMTVHIAPVAQAALDNKCSKAALASVISLILNQAMYNGVDLPKDPYIDRVIYLKNMQTFNVLSGDTVYTVLLCSTSPCIAVEAVIRLKI